MWSPYHIWTKKGWKQRPTKHLARLLDERGETLHDLNDILKNTKKLKESRLTYLAKIVEFEQHLEDRERPDEDIEEILTSLFAEEE